MFQRRRSGAIVCPRCGGLVDVNARVCPGCDAWRPGVWGFGPLLMQVRKAPVKEIIMAFCVFMYAASLLVFQPKSSEGASLFSYFRPTGKALLAVGATGRLPVVDFGDWETLLTAVFLHASVLHIFFNLFWIWRLGPDMAENYDNARFFLVFLLSGVAGNLAGVFLESSEVLIGASGGVYGLFGALVWYGYKRGGIVGMRVLRFSLFWGGIGLLFSLLPSVSIMAHAGGFIAGFGCGAFLGYEERRKGSPWYGLAAVGAAVCVLAAFFLFLGFPSHGLKALLQVP